MFCAIANASFRGAAKRRTRNPDTIPKLAAGFRVRALRARPGMTNLGSTETMARRPRYSLVLLLALLPAAALAGGLPPGFVYLRDVAPGIAQDMRYAGANNFTGAKVPGYDAPECVLRREAAEALTRVEADLAKQQLGLKVYDCYRPTRAVAAFARWAKSADDGATKRFHPKLDKLRLFSLGYIASHSAHSTGIAVDLTLVPLPTPPAAAFDAAASYGPCTGPAAARAPDTSLDMGTGFDCFDGKSHTASAGLTTEQARLRALLIAAMRQRGFRNYFREWWHFSFGARPALAYDFPIEAHP
jgi:zinc D-Ala-D-Ala dipeptidase